MFRLTQAPNLAIAQVWADLLCEAGYAATVERRYLSSIAGQMRAAATTAAANSGAVVTAMTTSHAKSAPDAAAEPTAATQTSAPRLRRLSRFTAEKTWPHQTPREDAEGCGETQPVATSSCSNKVNGLPTNLTT